MLDQLLEVFGEMQIARESQPKVRSMAQLVGMTGEVCPHDISSRSPELEGPARDLTFEAHSGVAPVTARKVAQPPKAAFDAAGHPASPPVS